MILNSENIYQYITKVVNKFTKTMNKPTIYTLENAHELRPGTRVKVLEGGENGEMATYCGFGSPNSPFYVKHDNGDTDYVSKVERPAPTKFEDLHIGDVVKDKHGSIQTILAVSGRVFALSYDNNPTTFHSWWTVDELKEYGYTIPSQETEDITELTLDQIADKFGVDASKIRVKKDNA